MILTHDNKEYNLTYRKDLSQDRYDKRYVYDITTSNTDKNEVEDVIKEYFEHCYCCNIIRKDDYDKLEKNIFNYLKPHYLFEVLDSGYRATLVQPYDD